MEEPLKMSQKERTRLGVMQQPFTHACRAAALSEGGSAALGNPRSSLLKFGRTEFLDGVERREVGGTLASGHAVVSEGIPRYEGRGGVWACEQWPPRRGYKVVTS